jgi:hypothetical protein
LRFSQNSKKNLLIKVLARITMNYSNKQDKVVLLRQSAKLKSRIF